MANADAVVAGIKDNRRIRTGQTPTHCHCPHQARSLRLKRLVLVDVPSLRLAQLVQVVAHVVSGYSVVEGLMAAGFIDATLRIGTTALTLTDG